MSTHVAGERLAKVHTAAEVASRQPHRRPHPVPKTGSTFLERWLLARALAVVGRPAITVELWDGQTIHGQESNEQVRLKVANRHALWRLAWDPWLNFGELYARDEVQVDGKLESLLTEAYVARQRKLDSFAPGWWRWPVRPRCNSLRRSQENIHHHYDIGNEFYKLWLDERMVYTCAYYAEATMTLEEAQIAKLDHVCRKLGLSRGQRVIEAGCGWGALAMHMARQYGVSVTAYNISREQVAFARQEAKRQGLDGQVEFVLGDWRTASGTCDAFVSVGMLEHVGRENYCQLGEVIDRCLAADGRGLIHSIGQNRPGPTSSWIERRIFPGAYPPALAEIIHILEPHDFSVLDVENLRLHYAQTLRHWLDGFEARVERVGDMYGELFVRMWRLYLCGSMVAFQTGGLQLFQLVFTRGDNNRIPWTRAGLYSEDGEVPAW